LQRRGRRLEVNVLGHRYPVRSSGGPSDEARVLAAAQLLNDRIAELQGATGEVEGQHLAVMAALSLADDVMAARDDRDRDRADDSAFRQTVRERSARLLELVEAELEARVRATG
jgi:cell division protein ZapA